MSKWKQMKSHKKSTSVRESDAGGQGVERICGRHCPSSSRKCHGLTGLMRPSYHNMKGSLIRKSFCSDTKLPWGEMVGAQQSSHEGPNTAVVCQSAEGTKIFMELVEVEAGNQLSGSEGDFHNCKQAEGETLQQYMQRLIKLRAKAWKIGR